MASLDTGGLLPPGQKLALVCQRFLDVQWKDLQILQSRHSLRRTDVLSQRVLVVLLNDLLRLTHHEIDEEPGSIRMWRAFGNSDAEVQLGGAGCRYDKLKRSPLVCHAAEMIVHDVK